MVLKDWRIKKKLSQKAVAETLAEMTGETAAQGNVSYWESGVMPRKCFRMAIMKLTKGKVTPSDFI